MGRRQRVLSIELGYATIRICEMEKGDKPKILHFLELATPELAVADGYISNEKLEEVKTVIVNALKQNKIKTKKAIFTLFSSKIITREIMLPDMKEKQLKQVIEENINDYFPIELEDFRVTHTKIDTELETDKTVRNKLLVIAAEKKLVAQYEKLAEMCRFTLIDVDYVGNSVFQALKKEPRFTAEMYVKVEAENTVIMILKDDRLVLQRSLNYGTGLGMMEEEQIREAIKPIVGTVTRVLHYYSGQSYTHIDQVTIIGSGAMYVDLFNEVGEDGEVTYKAIQFSEDNIVLKNDASKEKIPDFMASIGAGISSVKLINYKSSIKRVNYVRASVLMVILYIVVLASLGLMMYIPLLDAMEKNRDLKRLEKKYYEANEIHEEYVKTQAFHEKFLLADTLTKHPNDKLIAFLEELERKLPKDVVVSALNSDDESITIQMQVSTKEEAAGTIDTLRAFASVMDVEVTAVSEETKDEEVKIQKPISDEAEVEPLQELTGDTTVVKFTITCSYIPVHEEVEVFE